MWMTSISKKGEQHMQPIIQGKGIEITDWLRQYVEKKMGKLDKYLTSISEVRVELSTYKTKSARDSQVAQVTVRANGTILRAEEKSEDIFASIDAVLDKMHRQIVRFKGKRERRGRGVVGEPAPLPETAEETAEEEAAGRVVRVKRFLVQPMTSEEAIEQMELLGHDFFLFFNRETDSMNVLYRRNDGDYGLLQPEMA
jgi:putative sigma-54 modulation protein